MRTFVTGATGFIGRRLVERLVHRGDEVTALVRGQGDGLPRGVRAARGDIVEPGAWREDGQGYDRLYHLAALISFNPGSRRELARVNGQGTANVLAAAGRWRVPRTVVVSSACTLGIAPSRDRPLSEDSTAGPDLLERNPYLASKVEAERWSIREAGARPVVIVNPTTVYGPGDSSLNSGTLFRMIARLPLVPLPPGGSNCVDVDDVVEGILAAGEAGRPGMRYVLGGENLLFSEIFRTIASVMGKRIRSLPVPDWMKTPLSASLRWGGPWLKGRFLRPQVLEDLFSFKFYSSDRARSELGWSPRHAFRGSAERAWAFYRENGLLG